MAEIPDHAQRLIDDLIGEAAEHAMQARESLEIVNSIQRRYGLAPTTIADLECFGRPDHANEPQNGTAPPRPASVKQSGGSIRPDKYLGLPPLDAAKSYLSDLGHAASIDEIADAVSKGGAALQGGDWRDVLQMSLTRSVADVIKVQDGVFGLTKFYTPEQIKALRATRRQASPQPKRRGRPPKRMAARKTARRAEESTEE